MSTVDLIAPTTTTPPAPDPPAPSGSSFNYTTRQVSGFPDRGPEGAVLRVARGRFHLNNNIRAAPRHCHAAAVACTVKKSVFFFFSIILYYITP